MPIIQSCCCWRSLRRGCYASAIYTMVTIHNFHINITLSIMYYLKAFMLKASLVLFIQERCETINPGSIPSLGAISLQGLQTVTFNILRNKNIDTCINLVQDSITDILFYVYIM